MKLTQFDDAVIEVVVLKHYAKARDGKKYDVLKLQTEAGATFYMVSKAPLKTLVGYRARVWVKTKYLDFLDYVKGFVTKGNVVSITRDKRENYVLGDELKRIHHNKEIVGIYGALFLALPLSSALQERFSTLGVSHLLAISGFHLGVLSFILFTLLAVPYVQLQKHFFPYRSRHRDLFVLVAFILGGYLLFLGDVASLLRAYVMLLVGYFLYDRGMKIVSMQTLLVTLVVLLVLWPRLFFAMGFWLSLSGVYFIFLYLHYFAERSKLFTFIALPAWVYLMMTPVALVLFGYYSLYHPLSVLWSILFTLFYPLVLFLHLIGQGDLLDPLLTYALSAGIQTVRFELPWWWLIPYLLLSLAAYRNRVMLFVLAGVAFGVTVAAIYEVG